MKFGRFRLTHSEELLGSYPSLLDSLYQLDTLRMPDRRHLHQTNLWQRGGKTRKHKDPLRIDDARVRNSSTEDLVHDL